MNDVHDRWDKMIESGNKLIQFLGEMLLEQASNIDQSPPQEISIQDMEDLKQHYLDEMLSLSNDLQMKDYRNEKIDIRFRRECESMIDELKGKFNGMSIEINKKKELQHLEQVANLSTYPSQRFKSFFYDDDDDYDYEESTITLNEIVSQIPPSNAITPVLSTLEPKDSLIMGNEELSTIPEKESDEFIKSSVEDLVPIPSESKDTSESDSDCDLPSCDDFSPINVYEEKSVTFSNPLFDSNDDFTSSDDESLSDEDVLEKNVKTYSNPLFEFDDEYISSDVNPLFDEVLENIESKDSYVSNLEEPALLVTPLSDANKDECFNPGGDIDEIYAFLDMDISTDIKDDYHDSEGDIFYLESLLNLPPEVFLDHDPRSLMDELDKENLKSMVKVFDPRFLSLDPFVEIPSGESKEINSPWSRDSALTLVRANGITPRGEEELFFSKCISVEGKNDPTVEIEAYYGSNSNGYVEATQRMDPLLIFDDPSSWDDLGFIKTTLLTIGFFARIMEMKPDIENMTLNEYLEYEAEKERRLWDNVRSRRSPTNYDEADVDSFHRNKKDVIQPLIPTTLQTTPPNEDYVAPATKPILDKLLEDKILNVAMVDEEADPTRDLEEPERLLVEDPHFTKIQVPVTKSNYKMMHMEGCLVNYWLQEHISNLDLFDTMPMMMGYLWMLLKQADLKHCLEHAVS
ncbi:hypothetical protein Tco_0835252 [Tanacetum coccineum]